MFYIGSDIKIGHFIGQYNNIMTIVRTPKIIWATPICFMIHATVFWYAVILLYYYCLFLRKDNRLHWTNRFINQLYKGCQAKDGTHVGQI